MRERSDHPQAKRGGFCSCAFDLAGTLAGVGLQGFLVVVILAFLVDNSLVSCRGVADAQLYKARRKLNRCRLLEVSGVKMTTSTALTHRPVPYGGFVLVDYEKMRRASLNMDFVLSGAVSSLDGLFGKGFTKANPECLSSYLSVYGRLYDEVDANFFGSGSPGLERIKKMSRSQ